MRATNILSRIKSVLGTVDTPNYTEDYIFDEMNNVQRYLAEDLLCLEDSFTLNLINGTVDYDLTYENGDTSKPTGFYRLKLISPPIGSRILPLVEVDVNTFDLIRRFTYQSLVTPILYYKIWEGVLSFFPTPAGATPYTIYYYKTPITTISRTVEPELKQIFDKCLEYKTIAELAPSLGKFDVMQAYDNRYAEERQRVLNSWRRTKSVSNTINWVDIG